eukprot:6403287-Prymnesium_polylepis.1
MAMRTTDSNHTVACVGRGESVKDGRPRARGSGVQCNATGVRARAAGTRGKGGWVCALAGCPLPITAGAHANERRSLAL